MTILHIVYIVFASLGSIGLCAGGIGYFVSNFRDGANKKSTDELNSESTLLNYLKEQNAGYATALSSLKQQISDQDSKIAGLTATIAERDKQLDEYKALIGGRDTTTVQFQQFMTEFANTTTKILGKLTDKVSGLESSHIEIKEMVQKPTTVHLEGTASINEKQ